MRKSLDKLFTHLPLLVTGLLVTLMLRLLGFRRTLNLVSATRATTKQVRGLVPSTFRIPYLTCLEDSLAKAREMNKRGLGAALYIGVMREEDYRFHAWIRRKEAKGITLRFVKIRPSDLAPA